MSDSPNPYAPPSAAPGPAGVQWMANDPAALSSTALGLSLVYYGIVLLLLSFIVMVAAMFILAPAALLAMAGVLIGSILMFVGPLFCLSVPAETNAKGLIIASVVLQILNFAALLLPIVGVELAGFETFTQIFSVLASIFFVLFMKKLATFIGREDLASRATKVLLLGLTLFLGGIALVALVFIMGSPLPLSLLLLVILIAGLVLFVMYANLVNALSKALKEPHAT